MRIMRLKEVMNNTGRGRSTVYKYIAEGQFLKLVSLGDCDEWVMARIEQRDAGEPAMN